MSRSRSRSRSPTIPWDDPVKMSAESHNVLINHIINLIDALNYQYYNKKEYSYALAPVQNPIPTYVPSQTPEHFFGFSPYPIQPPPHSRPQ